MTERTYSLKRGKAFVLMDRREWFETIITNPNMHQFLYAGRMKVFGIRCIVFTSEDQISWAQPEYIAMNRMDRIYDTDISEKETYE